MGGRFYQTIICVIILLSTVTAQAKHRHLERWYQDKWCANNHGQAEVVLGDKTRCDCVTATHAVEFDFGKKWAESIGQALYYNIQTGKRSGIVLILEKPIDSRYWIRLNTVVEMHNLPIDVWSVRPEDYE